MYVDLQMLQDWILLDHHSSFYTVSTMFLHKYGGSNVRVKTCMLYFLCSSQSKTMWKWPMKTQDITKELVLFYICFSTCPIIYPVGPVYYCLGYPSNTISLSSLKCYVGFQNVVILLTFKFFLGDPFTRLGTIYTLFKYKFV